MTQPAAEQLLNLADRAERHALTAVEAQRLRDGINALEQLHQAHLNVEARLARDELAANRRAKQAEAAIERVRSFAGDIDTPIWRAPGTEVAARILAALDPQEPQPETAKEG